MPWKHELKNNLTTIEHLQEYVDLTRKERYLLNHVVARHPMSVTRYYLSLIDWDDPSDPIRKMAIPSLDELSLRGSYDTSGEKERTKLPGLQHKYPQTALILATNKCATYCRHCFRKRLVGLSTEEIIHNFSQAVKYIKSHPEINNVLITGGDPFMLETSTIRKFLEKVSAIPHLDFIRFGTRIPVTFPMRIIEDEELQKVLTTYACGTKKIYIVTQFNHPTEITTQATEAVAVLSQAGTLISNQTVLLKGVNDDPDTLAELQNRLVNRGIIPYYVFQCRPVKRVKTQFQVPLYQGYTIVEEAKKKLNGHGKRFRYVMSHKTGKIEIIGILNDDIVLKYHQAEDVRKLGKIFTRKLDVNAGWLDDLQ